MIQLDASYPNKDFTTFAQQVLAFAKVKGIDVATMATVATADTVATVATTDKEFIQWSTQIIYGESNLVEGLLQRQLEERKITQTFDVEVAVAIAVAVAAVPNTVVEVDTFGGKGNVLKTHKDFEDFMNQELVGRW